MDNVRCRGNETDIQLCSRNSWGYHDCFHFEDVSVRCGPDFIGKYVAAFLFFYDNQVLSVSREVQKLTRSVPRQPHGTLTLKTRHPHGYAKRFPVFEVVLLVTT